MQKHRKITRRNAQTIPADMDVRTSKEHLVTRERSLQANEFKFFRKTLRTFGFWHPEQATVYERVIYPVLVSGVFIVMLLFHSIYLIIALVGHAQTIGGKLNYDFIVDLASRLTVDVLSWLGHFFTVKYFRSRDMEQTLLNMNLHRNYSHEISKIKRGLGRILVASILANVFVAVLTFYNTFWLDTNLKSNATVTVTLDILALSLNYIYIPFNFFLIPVSLSLTWLMYLLCATSKLRLQQLRLELLHWNKPVEDAIHHYHQMYDVKVKKTSSNLKLLFISHNIIMVFLAPQFFYLCVEVGKKEVNFHFAIFFVLFVETLISWIAPLYFTERLRSNEALFQIEVNKLCPGYMQEVLSIEEEEFEQHESTFKVRSEVIKFLSYLKERQSGLIIGNYEFQLRISMWSLYLGVMVFFLKILV